MGEQEKTRQDASVRDLSRYTMRPQEAALEFEKAGVPVKLRAIQRYCWRANLDCILSVIKTFGTIEPAS